MKSTVELLFNGNKTKVWLTYELLHEYDNNEIIIPVGYVSYFSLTKPKNYYGELIRNSDKQLIVFDSVNDVKEYTRKYLKSRFNWKD